jgi:hypothetical protein
MVGPGPQRLLRICNQHETRLCESSRSSSCRGPAESPVTARRTVSGLGATWGAWWDETDFQETPGSCAPGSRSCAGSGSSAINQFSVPPISIGRPSSCRQQPAPETVSDDRPHQRPLTARCAIGFGLFPPDVRTVQGPAHRMIGAGGPSIGAELTDGERLRKCRCQPCGPTTSSCSTI